MRVFIGDYPDGDEERKVEIQIDPWDSYNADHTLALIALSLIKQLKETKHGSAMVDDEDVPEDIRSTSAAPKTSSKRFQTSRVVPDRVVVVIKGD